MGAYALPDENQSPAGIISFGTEYITKSKFGKIKSFCYVICQKCFLLYPFYRIYEEIWKNVVYIDLYRYPILVRNEYSYAVGYIVFGLLLLWATVL